MKISSTAVFVLVVSATTFSVSRADHVFRIDRDVGEERRLAPVPIEEVWVSVGLSVPRKYSTIDYTDGTIEGWYNYNKGDVVSANTPDGIEDANGNDIAIAAVQTSDGLSLVVIYDTPLDGSGGTIKSTTTCTGKDCGEFPNPAFIAVNDDPHDLDDKFFTDGDTLIAAHSWCCQRTDGFATKPLHGDFDFEVCFEFEVQMNQAGADDGVFLYESGTERYELDGFNTGNKICISPRPPTSCKGVDSCVDVTTLPSNFGEGSCNGFESCYGFAGESMGVNSCNQGGRCKFCKRNVGSNQCNKPNDDCPCDPVSPRNDSCLRAQRLKSTAKRVGHSFLDVCLPGAAEVWYSVNTTKSERLSAIVRPIEEASVNRRHDPRKTSSKLASNPYVTVFERTQDGRIRCDNKIWIASNIGCGLNPTGSALSKVGWTSHASKLYYVRVQVPEYTNMPFTIKLGRRIRRTRKLRTRWTVKRRTKISGRVLSPLDETDLIGLASIVSGYLSEKFSEELSEKFESLFVDATLVSATNEEIIETDEIEETIEVEFEGVASFEIFDGSDNDGDLLLGDPQLEDDDCSLEDSDDPEDDLYPDQDEVDPLEVDINAVEVDILLEGFLEDTDAINELLGSVPIGTGGNFLVEGITILETSESPSTMPSLRPSSHPSTSLRPSISTRPSSSPSLRPSISTSPSSSPSVSDADGDYIPYASDACKFTPSGAFKDSAGNVIVDEDGCALEEYCMCNASWKNHGLYVSCNAKISRDFVAQDHMTEAERNLFMDEVTASDCGKGIVV